MRDLSCQTINHPRDVSTDFGQLENAWFIASQLEKFVPATGEGFLKWKRFQRKPRLAFNQIAALLEPVKAWEFPPEYGEDPALPFSMEFITERTIRIKICSRADQPPKKSSLTRCIGAEMRKTPIAVWQPACVAASRSASRAFRSGVMTSEVLFNHRPRRFIAAGCRLAC